MAESIEARLKELGLTLPTAAAPLANYVPYLVSGDLLFITGQISKDAGGQVIKGCLGQVISLTGATFDVEQGQGAARQCALHILAQAKAAVGSLDKIEQVLRLTGFVASDPQFFDQPQVVNGASDLLVAVLGDKGRHTRAAVGVASLPAGAAVEIDAIIKVRM